MNKHISYSSLIESAICVQNLSNQSLNLTFQLYQGNNHLNFLFHDQWFCHARSSKNMARQVYLHRRPLVRCTLFGSFPKKNARIMNLKNPDLDLI